MPPGGARFARGLIGVLVFLAIGEVIGRIGLADRSYLPPSSAVLRRLAGLLAERGFLSSIVFTLEGWASGLLIACLIAIPAGLLLGALPGVNAAARVLIEFLRPIPAVALIPLVILMIADQGRLERTLAAYAATWPILMNTIYGVGDVDRGPVEMARVFGLRRPAIILRIVLPSVAPFVATGVRVAPSVALIVTVSTEMVSGGGANGIGQFVFEASGDPGGAPTVFAAVAVAGALGFVLDFLLRNGARRLFRWHFDRFDERR